MKIFIELKITVENKAISCLKQNESISTDFFCKEHSYFVNTDCEGYHDLNSELTTNKSTLKSLERLLVVVEEQMEYLRSKEVDKDTATYNQVKGQLDKKYKDLTSVLKETSINGQRIVINQEKFDNNLKYDCLSFVFTNWEKWKNYIMDIFRIIFEVNMKSEIEAKLQTLLLWSREVYVDEEDEKEQEKYTILDSVSSKIYGKTFKLCKIPIQSF